VSTGATARAGATEAAGGAAPRVAVSTISVIVPTLGASPLLADCLRALRDDGGGGADGGGATQIVLVCPRRAAVEALLGPAAALVDRWVETGTALGFAAATNRGIAAADGGWIATVNDDAVIEPGWTAALAGALAGDPRAAAAQGVNLTADGATTTPALTDGWGLGWNGALQAVQLGHGEPPPAITAPPREVFGVSATAALYRRAALDEVALAEVALASGGGQNLGSEIFDSGLGSYYEDADLACRLRAAGWRALSVPAARARHAGSLTGRRRAVGRWARVYGNRHLVLARHLGRAYRRRLPALLWRDGKDWLTAPFSQPARLAGVPAGWLRAVRHLAAYGHQGEPLAALVDAAAEAAP
jgi:GT2 family glycosyltransferase